jgi:hypothetical protein
MKVFTWLGKNLGLLLGVVEIFVIALCNVAIQVLKSACGIINVLQPQRSTDKLVDLAAQFEKMIPFITSGFTAAKGWLYSIGNATVAK